MSQKPLSIEPPKCLPTQKERRQLIIAAAREHFLANGYGATTMSGVAAALGGSKTTLWSYFPSKETLFSAVIEETTSGFAHGLLDDLEAGGPPDIALTRFAERFVEKLLAPDTIALYRMIIGEGGKFPEIGLSFYKKGPFIVLRKLESYLAEEMVAGRLGTADPVDVARQLVGMLQLVQQYRLWNVSFNESGGTSADYARRCARSILKQYGVPPE